MALVLLFSTIADPSRAALVHDESCRLVWAASRSRGKTKIIRDGGEKGDSLAEIAADLRADGFPVRICKCCPPGTKLRSIRR